MKINKRNYLLDNLKAILIFFVVFGHVIEYYVADSRILKAIYIAIYVFHMPLFVYISGYFSKKTKGFHDSVNTLIIPYIIFNLVWYTAVYLKTGDAMFSVVHPGWTLWYLVSLFFWRIILPYIIKIKYIVWISFGLGLIIGMVPIDSTILSLSRTIVFMPFFLLGVLSNEKDLEKIKKYKKILPAVLLSLLVIAAIYISFYTNINYKFLYNSNSYAAVNLSIIKGVVLRVFSYVGAVTLIFSTINIVSSKKRFYSYIGKATMSVYLLHIYVVILVYAFIPKWNMGVIQNSIILISPFFIVYILSHRYIDKTYKVVFKPIHKGYDKSIGKIRR